MLLPLPLPPLPVFPCLATRQTQLPSPAPIVNPVSSPRDEMKRARHVGSHLHPSAPHRTLANPPAVQYSSSGVAGPSTNLPHKCCNETPYHPRADTSPKKIPSGYHVQYRTQGTAEPPTGFQQNALSSVLPLVAILFAVNPCPGRPVPTLWRRGRSGQAPCGLVYEGIPCRSMGAVAGHESTALQQRSDM